MLDQARCFGGTDYGLHYESATYQLRYAETLINLARHAPDRVPLLRQATAMLDTIDGPLPKRRLLGVRTAQAQAAVGLGAYERAAVYANEAVSVGNDMATTTHLPAMTGVYHTLRQTRYANEPLTTKVGLTLWRFHQS
ncbi:MAG TPA: hypothetical protein VFV38_07180 [Ktedonobacteraceae bacterium]|nr:hypothetical protein [Ktedonobacteraceae bacterium]